MSGGRFYVTQLTQIITFTFKKRWKLSRIFKELFCHSYKLKFRKLLWNKVSICKPSICTTFLTIELPKIQEMETYTTFSELFLVVRSNDPNFKEQFESVGNKFMQPPVGTVRQSKYCVSVTKIWKLCYTSREKRLLFVSFKETRQVQTRLVVSIRQKRIERLTCTKRKFTFT